VNLGKEVCNKKYTKNVNETGKLAASKLLFITWVDARPKEDVYALWEKVGKAIFDHLDKILNDDVKSKKLKHFEQGAWHLCEAIALRSKAHSMTATALKNLFDGYVRDNPEQQLSRIIKQRGKAVSMFVRYYDEQCVEGSNKVVGEHRRMMNKVKSAAYKQKKYSFVYQIKEFEKQINCVNLSNPHLRKNWREANFRESFICCKNQINSLRSKAFIKDREELKATDIRFENVSRLINTLFEIYDLLLTHEAQKRHDLKSAFYPGWGSLTNSWVESVGICIEQVSMENKKNPRSTFSKEEEFIKICENLISLTAKADVLFKSNNLSKQFENLNKHRKSASDKKNWDKRMNAAKLKANIYIALMNKGKIETKNVPELKRQAPMFMEAYMGVLSSGFMRNSETIKKAFYTIKSAYFQILPSLPKMEVTLARQFLQSSVLCDGLPKQGDPRCEMLVKYYPLGGSVDKEPLGQTRWALSDLLRSAQSSSQQAEESLIQVIKKSARSAVAAFLAEPQSKNLYAGDVCILARHRQDQDLEKACQKLETYFVDLKGSRDDVMDSMDHYLDGLAESGYSQQFYEVFHKIIEDEDHLLWKLPNHELKRKLVNSLAAACLKCAFHEKDKEQKEKLLKEYEKLKRRVDLSEEDFAYELKKVLDEYDSNCPDLTWAMGDLGLCHDRVVGNLGIILAKDKHYRHLLHLVKCIGNPGRRTKYLPDWIQEAIRGVKDENDYANIYSIAKEFMGRCAGHPVAAYRLYSQIYLLRKKLARPVIDFSENIEMIHS